MTNTDFTARCMAGKALDDVAGKQDVITDLDTIRAGAAAGATAVQPAELDNYQTKIDSTHKLDADLVDDTDSTNKFATQSQLDQIGINENNILYNTNTGVKNLFNNTATSGSQKGVTYTVNSDGTVTTSDSTTSGSFILILGAFTFEQGKTYYFTGCPSGGTQNGYRLCTLGDTYADDFGNGDEVVGDGSTKNIAIYVRSSGTNMDGLTFKPMIREIGDDTYQPYAMSNAEITAWILAHS